MRKYYFFVGLFFSFLHLSFAQVNLPTGRAEVSFPLYNYSDGNGLSTAIILNYTGGGGIKVDEMASNVGLGWDLNTGGVITRSMVGEPDDQVSAPLTGYDAIADGYLYNNYSGVLSPPLNAGWLPMASTPILFYRHNAATIADREQDIFYFNFGNEQGSFVIGKDGSIRALNENKLKIEKVVEDLTAIKIITRISKFIITTETGIKYTFSDKNLRKLISYQSGAPVMFYGDVPTSYSYFMSKTGYKINDYYVADSWYLTEILNPQTNKKITYTYDTNTLSYIGGQQATQSIREVDDDMLCTIQWMQMRFEGLVKRISRISLPNNTTVEFKYAENDRVDLPGSKALKQLVVKENGEEKSGYLLTYQYFSHANVRAFDYAFPTEEIELARLSLASLQKTGRNNFLDKPYSFIYYIGYTTGVQGWVPARMAASVDHWGYNNGSTAYPYTDNLNIYKNLQNLFLASRRNVYTPITIAKNGALRTIKYPTGGTLEYEYESNKVWANADTYCGGVRVKKVTESDGLAGAPKHTNEYKYVEEDGKSSGLGYEAPVYDGVSSVTMAVGSSSGNYLAGAVYSLIAGGTSIIGLVTSAASYIYKLFTSPNNVTVTQQNIPQLYSSHPANQNPLPFLYDRVEEYSGTVDDNIGKTVYEFTSTRDLPYLSPVYAAPYSHRQRFFEGAYGLLKRKVVYNKLGQPVTEIYNKYSFLLTELSSGYFQSASHVPNKMLFCEDDLFNAYSSNIKFDSEIYYPVAGRVQLDYTTNKTYTINNDYMFTKTEYTYDPTYYNIKKVVSTNSIGEKIEERSYYPYDYNIAGPLTEMKNLNILSVPVSNEVWLQPVTGDPKLLSATINDYQKLTNGDYKPVKQYGLLSTTPLPKATIGDFNPAQLNRNTTYFKLLSSTTYNAASYVNQYVTDKGIESKLYDDNIESTIAIAQNAIVSDIAYTSFEQGAKGNWNITSPGVITADLTSPSGSNCMKLSTPTTLYRSGLSTGKELLVSYWYKGGSVQITGATILQETTGQTVNGWTLRSVRVNQTGTVTISGDAYIDEVRLYPTEAKMITFCYDALMNISAKTASDNTAVYYEYDELGRMKISRDLKRNVIQVFEYKDSQ